MNKFVKWNNWTIWAYVGMFFLSSCAYHMGFNRYLVKESRQEKKKLFIPVAENRSLNPGVEATMTSTLRELLSTLQDVKIVNQPEDAEYLLLCVITHYLSIKGDSVVLGNSGSEGAGGLAYQQSTAADIKVSVDTELSLFHKPQLDKALWVKKISKSGNFDTIRRFKESEGATSSVHLNASREQIQYKIITQDIAQDLIQQLSHDF